MKSYIRKINLSPLIWEEEKNRDGVYVDFACWDSSYVPLILLRR